VPDIAAAISGVLDNCLGVASGEQVLVLTDPTLRGVAEALVAGARERDAEALLAEMAERSGNGEEPPRAIVPAMAACDVLIAPTAKSLSHTEARHAASAAGVRAATMPGVTEDMLGRTMATDLARLRDLSQAVADILTEGNEVRISSEGGTDVTVPIHDREGLADDGDLTSRGAFGNLPPGEGFIAPVEGGTRGRIVFDGSIWPIGRLDEPLVVDIEDGYAVDISGPHAGTFRALLEPHGREAFAVAELGIGTNESAILTGNVLEDEKILGTIHVAFGDNHSFGGRIRVSSHQDGVVLRPTVQVDGRRILHAGRLEV
jgi:aminopeptidase